MFTVYVIQSATGKRYTGHTDNLERRLSQHNSGLCKTTKVDSNWKEIYSEQYAARGEAIERERWMKTGIGREFIDKVMQG